MTHIKSRKHPAQRIDSAQAIAAATLMTGLALACPGVASAQVASGPFPGEVDKTLDRIDVTADRVKRYGADSVSSPKFTQPLLDTTQTINVIGKELFNEQGATTLTEALRNSPGVGTFYVGENGNTTTGDAVYLRGFDTSGSIFVDGIRDLGSVSRDVFNIEQIEVTKGPSGPDNGRTSPTGAINLVTKQPTLRDANSATVSYGSDDQQRVTADFNQAVNGGSAFRINLLAQDSGLPGRDAVNRKRWAVAPSVAFGLDTATRVYVNLLHVDQDNMPDGGVPTIGLPGYGTPDPLRPQLGTAPRVDSENFYGISSDFDDVTADMFTVRVERDFSDDLHLQSTTRWGQTQQDYQLTAFRGATANLVTPDLDDPSTWTITRDLPTFKDQDNRILTNQTNLRAHFGSGSVQHDLSTGVELAREQLQTYGVVTVDGGFAPPANLYDPDLRVPPLQTARNGAQGTGKTETVSVYAFDTFKLGEQWQLNGGVRFDDYTTDFRSSAVCSATRAPLCGALPAGSVVPSVDARDSDTLFNWKVGVLFKPTPVSSLYANYAVSQQPPGGGTLELSGTVNNANNPIFDPQEAETAEIGVKWNVLDDALLLTAAIYDTTITNEIVQDPVDLQYFQTGEKRVRGVEISAVGNISDAWSMSAGFTTMDTEVTSGPAITADGSTDLTYTPKNAFTSWTTYTFANGLSIGGGARYNGELKRGTDGAIGTPSYTEDYWVVDAVASYVFSEHVDLRLNAYNLFDEDYVAAINKSGYRYTPGQPRSYMLTANFRF